VQSWASGGKSRGLLINSHDLSSVKSRDLCAQTESVRERESLLGEMLQNGEIGGASGGDGNGAGAISMSTTSDGTASSWVSRDASSCVSSLVSVSVGVPAWRGSGVRGTGTRGNQGSSGQDDQRFQDGAAGSAGWQGMQGMEKVETLDMWVREVLAICVYAFKGYV